MLINIIKPLGCIYASYVYDNLSEAYNKAQEYLKKVEPIYIIQSKDYFYVEPIDPGFLRSWETIIAKLERKSK